MPYSYKLIQEARERASSRSDMMVLTPTDDTAKEEYLDGTEEYAPGFRDYHGPPGDAENPNG